MFEQACTTKLCALYLFPFVLVYYLFIETYDFFKKKHFFFKFQFRYKINNYLNLFIIFIEFRFKCNKKNTALNTRLIYL